MLLWMALRLQPDLNLVPEMMKQPATNDVVSRPGMNPESHR